MSTAKPKNSAIKSSLTQSWASSVADYVLTRRQHTKLAYSNAVAGAPNSNDIDIGNKFDDSNVDSTFDSDALFSALFIALAQQLEEGHTVLTLSADELLAENSPKHVKSEPYQSLHNQWQQNLLDILALPLQDLINTQDVNKPNTDAGEEHGLTVIKNLLSQWAEFKQQFMLSNYQKQLLNQRCQLLENLLTLFDVINTVNLNQKGINNKVNKNSLSNFISIIQTNPLMADLTKIQSTLSSSSVLNTANLTAHNLPDKPICFFHNLTDKNTHPSKQHLTLWLHRAWQAEYTLCKHILRIANSRVTPLPITINPLLNTEQKAAINIANNHAFSIITGGPGTGKTFTVAQLVIALKQSSIETQATKQQKAKPASLALAAPTGKAAQRMQESLQAALDAAKVSLQLQEAKTIHRLLSIGVNGRPRYHADNPLSEDIIIVDEASMLGVELANHLVSAVKDGARLILLGDANQLAAVDAGAVLADLCRIPSLQSMHQTLVESRRFNETSGIGKLARLINNKSDASQLPQVWQLFNDEHLLNFYSVPPVYSHQTNHQANKNKVERNENSNNIHEPSLITKNSLSKYNLLKKMTKNYKPYLIQIKNTLTNNTEAKFEPTLSIDLASSEPKSTSNHELSNAKNIAELMQILNQFKILTAGHHGQWGDHALNEYLTQWHINELKLPLSNSPWYHGRPIMVLQNSYELGLFNGDIGICLQTEQGMQVFFEAQGEGGQDKGVKNKGVKSFAVNLLSDEMVATAYAMTIHKSQGSEFEHVAITFDDSNMRLLSKELIYTAVTRAKKQVSIFSTPSALQHAITTPTIRQTGLALQFEHMP